MLLEVVGGQKNDIAADDVTVSVMYRYISGSSWIEIGGAQKKLPTDTSATTTIEFQPPIGQAVTNNNQLHLRINFQTASVGTSFVLKTVKLYALNEWGEATYTNFKVKDEEDFYKVEVAEDSVDFKMSQNKFFSYGVRTVSASFILGGQNFTTKDRDHDSSPGGNCADGNLGGWWYSACHSGSLTGVYPSPEKKDLPIPFTGINIFNIMGYYSNLQSLEMKIKPDDSHAEQPGSSVVVASCAALASSSSSSNCAQHCIDRPMQGGQHPMGVWCFAKEENNIWWISPTGNDDQGIGTEERPMATISQAMGRSNSGDYIHLKSGIYKGGDESCNWCTEVPLWVNKRCGLYPEIC